jgi:redox-regulated HSP33 family molecular chaperone
MQRAILTLAGQDQGDLLEREEGLEVRCEFCRQSYHFSHEETRDLLLPPASGPH